MSAEPTLFDESFAYTHARVSDPDTSQAAAAAISTRDTHLRVLLAVFQFHQDGLTAEEAAAAAGVDPWAASKRVSDLVRAGLIEDTGRRRPGSSGRAQRVLQAVSA